MSDWPALLRLAVGMNIAPEAFWRLSAAEWRAITAPPPSDALGREALQGLMAAWPDRHPVIPEDAQRLSGTQAVGVMLGPG